MKKKYFLYSYDLYSRDGIYGISDELPDCDVTEYDDGDERYYYYEHRGNFIEIQMEFSVCLDYECIYMINEKQYNYIVKNKDFSILDDKQIVLNLGNHTNVPLAIEMLREDLQREKKNNLLKIMSIMKYKQNCLSTIKLKIV